VTPKDTPHRFGHTATPGIPKHVKALLKKFETSRNLHNFPKNAYILFDSECTISFSPNTTTRFKQK
jgi:hypothetical protein